MIQDILELVYGDDSQICLDICIYLKIATTMNVHIISCRWYHSILISFIVMAQIRVLISSENFYDFNCVPGGKSSTAPDGYQYISPNLTFPCDGVVTKWKIGTEDEKDDQVYLQIWQPVGTGYSRVAETVYTNSRGQTIAEVSSDMTVSAGDVIGFFIPRNKGGNNVGLKVAWAPVPDHTLLRGRQSAQSVSPVATFTGSSTTLSSSPLVSVIFSKCTVIVCIIPLYCCHVLCVSI